MTAFAGWKQPPAGVPIEPDPHRSYVSLSDAAQRLGVDRRTLLRALKRGDTPGWARPGPDNLRWYVYADVFDRDHHSSTSAVPAGVPDEDAQPPERVENAELRARLAAAEDDKARLDAENADLRARLVSAEESNLLLIAAHADLAAAAEKYRQALSLYMTPGHIGTLTS